MKKNKNGFTLIEVLAVIIVLGIILVIATTTITKSINNSRNEAFITSFDNLTDEVKKRILEHKVNKNIQIQCADERYIRQNELPTCSDEYELSSTDYNAAIVKKDNNYIVVLKGIGKFKNIDYSYKSKELLHKYIYPFDYDVNFNIYGDGASIEKKLFYNYKKNSLLIVISNNGKNVEFFNEYTNYDISEIIQELENIK